MLVALGAWFFTRDNAPETSPAKDDGKPIVWPFEQSHRYRFSYRSSETVRPLGDVGNETVVSGDEIKAAMHLEGELVFDAFAEKDRTAGLRIASLDKAELSVQDSDVPDLASILTGGSLGLRFGPQQTFTHYTQSQDANPLLVQTLRALAMRMQVAAAPKSVDEESFKIVEQLPHGRALSEYRRPKDLSYERTRPKYLGLDVIAEQREAAKVDLDAKAEIALRSKSGPPDAIRDSETVNAAVSGIEVLDGTSNLELTWISSEPLTKKALPAGVSRPLAEVPTSEGLEQKVLSQRTEGLTRQAAIEMLLKYMNGGKLPDHRRALWRLTGLLEQDPEFARELLKLFLMDSTNSRGRALLLDLLVSVGNDEAQAAVREALASDASRNDKSRGVHYQRLGLIDEPNAETLKFARDELDRARAGDDLENTIMNAYTAGAVAGHAAKSDDPAMKADAEAVGDAITTMLLNTDDPKNQKFFIKALSNTKDERRQEKIAEYKDNPNDGVRQSVARSMKDPPTDLGLETLIALAADPDPFVQSEAVRALSVYTLSPEHWAALIAIVRSGGLHKRNHRIMLDFVKHKRQIAHDETTQLLEAMLGLNLDGEVAGAVRLLLSS